MSLRRQRSLGAEVLRGMRRTRRRFYAQKSSEVFYRIYVGAIFGSWGLVVLANAIADAPVDERTVDWLANRAPALLGIVIAVGVLGGLRSGMRGGPSAIEAADVQYALLAPIDRGMVLRHASIRQLRTAAFVGLVVGAIVGNFTFRRFPGSPAEWLGCLALFGAAVPALVLSAATLASNLRLRPLLLNLLGCILVAWSLCDFLLETVTSPLTMLGGLAVLPLHGSAGEVAPLVCAGVVLAIAVVALALVGGISLEAARRRSTLVVELRFAASVQDLRSVVLLRRELASEGARRRPWRRLRSSTLAGSPIGRRDWQSLLRWPAIRILRIILLGAIAGIAASAAWSGTTPAVAVAGLALVLAGFDVIEPFAQEVDHPTRRDLLPVDPRALARRHLLVPAIVMAMVALAGVVTAMALGSPGLAARVGVVMVIPTSVLIVCSAAVSAMNDPYAHLDRPGIGLAWTLSPVGISIFAVGAPVLAAREMASHGHAAIAVAGAVELAMLALAVGLVWGVGLLMAQRTAVEA